MKKMIIGLGTGRCGTVTLTSILNNQTDIHATHETSLSSWDTNVTDFNKTLDIIQKYNSTTVSDVSFYNLNYIENFINVREDTKFICLKRNKDEVIESYMKKTIGRNHWSGNSDNLIGYKEDLKWDKCYPKYNLPKEDALAMYWEDYYSIATEMEKLYPNNIKVFDMNTVLNTTTSQSEMLSFIDIPEKYQIINLNTKLNALG